MVQVASFWRDLRLRWSGCDYGNGRGRSTSWWRWRWRCRRRRLRFSRQGSNQLGVGIALKRFANCFLQIAFRCGSYAGLAKADYAIFIQYHVGWKGIDLERLQDVPLQIDVFRPVHLLFGNERLPDIHIIVGTDAHELKCLAGIFLVQVAQHGLSL